MIRYLAGLLLGVVIAAGFGCGTLGNVEACYVHPDYGQVCVKYDGKLHVRADIAADPERLAEVKDWLRKQGAKVE